MQLFENKGIKPFLSRTNPLLFCRNYILGKPQEIKSLLRRVYSLRLLRIKPQSTDINVAEGWVCCMPSLGLTNRTKQNSSRIQILPETHKDLWYYSPDITHLSLSCVKQMLAHTNLFNLKAGVRVANAIVRKQRDKTLFQSDESIVVRCYVVWEKR